MNEQQFVDRLVTQIKSAILEMLNETCDELEPKFTKASERKVINAFSDVMGEKVLSVNFKLQKEEK